MRSRAAHFCLLLLFLPLYNCFAADLHIDFTEETLDNGLHVIYAPLHQSPVVHVRLQYHVGSRDERPERQGFAHMFEHMMFRGSAHVKADDHQLLMAKVGGSAGAFTDFDQTVYEDNVPANQLELALYLEADRMASFKVSDETFQIERNVVFEEMRRLENEPYGGVYDHLFQLLFTKHSYRWSRIGQMTHLKATKAPELQGFFNTYYIPNNATLIIAGDIDSGVAKALVRKYFGWIPRGALIPHQIPPEPAQTEPRRAELFRPVPLPFVMIAWHGPPSRSDDHYALNLLSTILGKGRFSRLNRFLLARDSGKAAAVYARNYILEDGGYFMVSATVLPGKDPVEVEKDLTFVLNSIRENGITQQDLLQAKVSERVDFIYGLATAKSIAVHLGDGAIMAGDASRVNSALGKIEAITASDIQAVARKYLRPQTSTVLHTIPQPPSQTAAPAVERVGEAIQVVAGGAAPPRAISFPPDYPQEPPIAPPHLELKFPRGIESEINGVKVVVMSDHRLPTISWRLTLRSGIHHDPIGKEGLAHLTAHVINDNISDEDLEARGVSLSLKEENQTTSFQGYCLSEDVDFALARMRETLHALNLRERLFSDLKAHSISALRYTDSQPATAAKRALAIALFGSSPMGRFMTAKTLESISFEDVQAAHKRLFCPNEAIFVIAGDITVERGQKLAQMLFEGWKPGVLPNVDFTLPPPSSKRRIILIDRPESKQAVIYVGARAYNFQSEEHYSGTMASGILTTRINLSLGAQKGLIYVARAGFEPGRHAGQFTANTETDISTAATTIDAMLHLFDDAGKNAATETELNDARLCILGATAMSLQTVGYQASYRESIILYNLPIDYYQKFPLRAGQVTPEQVRQVISKYLRPEAMVIVVVAPAAAVKSQLERFGTVEVQPMQ